MVLGFISNWKGRRDDAAIGSAGSSGVFYYGSIHPASVRTRTNKSSSDIVFAPTRNLVAFDKSASLCTLLTFCSRHTSGQRAALFMRQPTACNPAATPTGTFVMLLLLPPPRAPPLQLPPPLAGADGFSRSARQPLHYRCGMWQQPAPTSHYSDHEPSTASSNGEVRICSRVCVCGGVNMYPR